MSNKKGTLYIVATPIGNLQDITLRAIDILKSVDWIAAEDTRHSLGLLQHLNSRVPMISLHDYNEQERAIQLIDYLKKGENIALISDAGTPLISDPGFRLVREVMANHIPVVPIPGPCAAIAALSAAGLPTDTFLFAGFLAAKSSARKQRLSELQTVNATLIFYESPHRILETLQDMQEILGAERQAVIARELTKKFETIQSGTLSTLEAFVKKDKDQQRGEIVLLVEGAKKIVQADDETKKILTILLKDLPLKQAVSLTADITGGRKNDIYQLALQLK